MCLDHWAMSPRGHSTNSLDRHGGRRGLRRTTGHVGGRRLVLIGEASHGTHESTENALELHDDSLTDRSDMSSPTKFQNRSEAANSSVNVWYLISEGRSCSHCQERSAVAFEVAKRSPVRSTSWWCANWSAFIPNWLRTIGEVTRSTQCAARPATRLSKDTMARSRAQRAELLRA